MSLTLTKRSVSANVSANQSLGNVRQPLFAFRTVGDDEIRRAMMKVKSNAVGLDSIPLRFIKMIILDALPYFKHILNFSITSSKFVDGKFRKYFQSTKNPDFSI